MAFDGVAKILEKTITDEASIDAAIGETEVAELLKGLQSDFDKLRGEKSTAEKALADYKQSHPEGGTNPEPKSNEELNALRAQIAQIQSEMAAKSKAERLTQITNDVDRLLKEKGATNDYIRRNVLKGLEIGDADTAESLATTLRGKYDAEMKEAFGEGYVPPRGSQHQEGYKPGAYDDKIAMLRREGILPQAEK